MRLSGNDEAVLAALLPSGAHPLLGIGIVDQDIGPFLAEFRKTSPPHLWRAFRLGLFCATWVAPLLLHRLPPIGRLGESDRERALAAMAVSQVPELRQLVSVLKSVVCLHYGGLSEVRAAIGYP